MQSKPTIITVAITGSVPMKSDNPAVPITVNEQIESTQESYESGASIVHIHVRDENGKPSSNVETFAEVIEGIKKFCPGMVIQTSTGGRGRDHRERGSSLCLKPDMASLATGSVNFPNIIYENAPELIRELASKMKSQRIKPEIEVFDLSMIYRAAELVEAGLIDAPIHAQFIFGIKNGLPPREEVLNFFISELLSFIPGSTWTASGIGRYQELMIDYSISKGGHARTGLEDNIRLNRETLAPSNAALVRIAAQISEKYERPIASVKEARSILNLD